MNTYRVLSETKLLGHQRKYGDTISPEEASMIPQATLRALVSTGILEGETDIRPPDGWDEQLQHLHARLDQINDTLTEMVRMLKLIVPEEVAKDSPSVVLSGAETPAKPKQKPRGRPRKETIQE